MEGRINLCCLRALYGFLVLDTGWLLKQLPTKCRIDVKCQASKSIRSPQINIYIYTKHIVTEN